MMLFEMEEEVVPEIEACNCQLDCSVIDYELKVVETKLKVDHQYVIYNNQSWWVNTTYNNGLSFAFGDTEYFALKRYANYEAITFISDVGGLLGLFLGVSVMSVIEIFYLLVIRVSVEIVRYFKRQRSRIKRASKKSTDLSFTLEQIY
jgi:Amiloride-sensitive sodium channel